MDKLQKIFGKEWAEELSPFLRSDEFEKIGREIKILQSKRLQITPAPKDIFRAFLECPYHKMHTILLAGGPYVGKNERDDLLADGLAFSARRSVITPNSLKVITEAIGDEVYNGEIQESMLGWDNDLSYLANDGILLLNTGLTTVIGESSTKYISLWQPFISFVLKLINYKKDSMGVILFGDYAKAYKGFLDNPTFAVYSCEHPNESMLKNKKWDSENSFKALDNFHKSINNIHIKW